MVHIQHVSKKFVIEKQELLALADINLEIKNNEFFTIIGPSGCGKSTLLRIIAGLDTPTEGTISWDSEKTIGFVFQNFALFPFLSVLENIEFGLKMQGVAKKKMREIAKNLAEEVGLSGYEDKHPKELSGGMKQRVGIARALAIDPSVLLLDEPFSSLDEFTAQTLRALLINIWEKRKITAILVTHLISEAAQLSDRIAVLTHSPGKVEKIIENKLKRPRNLRSKQVFEIEDTLSQLITF